MGCTRKGKDIAENIREFKFRSMGIQQALHMNSGEGEKSYAKNSIIQMSIMLRTKPYIEEAMQELFSTVKPERLNIADLGCGSGPNSLLPVAMILDAAGETSKRMGCRSSESQAFLNDLPENDFNTVFKAIPSFYQNLDEKEDGPRSCFVSATPGSFYGRLFPKGALHFVYSALALHWLSQVPLGLTGEKAKLNKGNIYVSRNSPMAVFEAYSAQFQRDFTVFLKSRSEEIVPGGSMVLTLKGRRLSNPFAEHNEGWDSFADALRDMILKGTVEEGLVDSFNVPYYEPHIEELREIIQSEGSFNIMRLDPMPGIANSSPSSDTEDDEDDNNMINHNLLIRSKENHNLLISTTRAITEPLLASHFGQARMDELFETLRGKLVLNKDGAVVLVVSLVRKF